MIDIPPGEWAAIQAERSAGQIITDLRADRDSLHDALAALVIVLEDNVNLHHLMDSELHAVASARHVLGEKRA